MLLLLAACSPALEHEPRTTAPVTPAPSGAPGTGGAARARDGASKDATWTLLDPGRPPRRRLRYALDPGSAREFRIEQRLTLFEGDAEVGSVELRAPLVVRAQAAPPAGYSLRVELGPTRVTREGQSEAIRWGGLEPGPSSSEGRLLAVVDLAASGEVREARIEESPGAEAALLFETLLGLDAPPSEAVGAGARWRTRREQPGSVQTLAEHELMQVLGNVATFRVQRHQTDDRSATSLRSIGEWNFTRDAWPPTGHDLLSAALPKSGPGARFSVRFAVSAGAVDGAANGPAR